MFGHDHEDKKDDNSQPISTKPVNHGLLGIDDDNDAPVGSSTTAEPSSSPLPDPSQTTTGFVGSSSALSDDSNDKTPEPPTLSSDSAVINPDSEAPSAGFSPSTTGSASEDDLVDIKRQALQELSPLIDHLDQNSEEKFKTTMMMIQASDDKDLIPQAFKAAKEITDEKKRAQALLDIVNEINYFTHKTED